MKKPKDISKRFCKCYACKVIYSPIIYKCTVCKRQFCNTHIHAHNKCQRFEPIKADPRQISLPLTEAVEKDKVAEHINEMIGAYFVKLTDDELMGVER